MTEVVKAAIMMVFEVQGHKRDWTKDMVQDDYRIGIRMDFEGRMQENKALDMMNSY